MAVSPRGVTASAPDVIASPLRDRVSASGPAIRRASTHLRWLVASVGLAVATVAGVEVIAGKPLADTLSYFTNRGQPAWTITWVVLATFLVVDAVLGREHKGALILAPAFFFIAAMSVQKQVFLTDPLYPTDLLFGRQILELMPALVEDRPWTAVAAAFGLLGGLVGLGALWIYGWRRFRRLGAGERLARIAIGLPVLAGFISIMDYNSWSETRDRLRIYPILWDQTENYRHNGFLLAFLINLPMANVQAPSGYSADAIADIPTSRTPAGTSHRSKPDVILVMSESLWDPTRMTGVTLTPDPMPTIRAHQTGDIFSPEFGGLTANVEFEALTGFSNAFLPTGSIPYQQYIRDDLPSLATFFRSEGYATEAIHPYEGWFWNRTAAYKALGFETFKDVNALPALEMRGNFPADAALTREIIHQADKQTGPFFFFVVTLQGHGPYEAGRYPREAIKVEGLAGAAETRMLSTFAHGIKESDGAFRLLIDWASRRDRETIIVLFGDHLPPLTSVYTQSGYMPFKTAARKATPERMKKEHETPLVIWSNRVGALNDLGSISPAFLPYHVLRMAGYDHPFYTGLLGRVHERYDVVDRYLLMDADGGATTDWARKPAIDPLLRDFRNVQYDVMFGERHGAARFFPAHPLTRATGF